MNKVEVSKVMSEFLINRAEKRGIKLQGLNKVNYNSFIDRAFNDGGDTRKKFLALADKYKNPRFPNHAERINEAVEGAVNMINGLGRKNLCARIGV